MRHYRRQRKVERIRLFPALTGTLDGRIVGLVEVSLHGGRVRSEVPFDPLRAATLKFFWEERELTIETVVKRCFRDRETQAFELGLSFQQLDESSFASIYRLIDCHVEDALHRQAANAAGLPLSEHDRATIRRLVPSAEDRALLRLHEDRNRGFIRYALHKGKWSREATWEPVQPEEGFTIWAYEDNDRVADLCRIFESSDEATRELIRLCAKMSLYVDDSEFAPQYFEP